MQLQPLFKALSVALVLGVGTVAPQQANAFFGFGDWFPGGWGGPGWGSYYPYYGYPYYGGHYPYYGYGYPAYGGYPYYGYGAYPYVYPAPAAPAAKSE